MPNMTNPDIRWPRRAFLAAGAAGLAALGTAPARAQEAADPYAPLKVGVHSYSLRKLKFAEAVAATRALGVRYIGLNPIHLPLKSTPEACAEAKQAIAAAGLELLACGVVGFGSDKAAARQAFEYARRMGMKTIVANPKPEAFAILDPLVEEFQIRIAIHNHGPGSIYSTPGDVLEAVEGHSPLIGACVDVGHYERSGVKAADAIAALAPRIYDVHLKDVNKAAKEGHGVILGQGIIDLPAVIDALVALKFDGHTALEFERDPEDPVPGMQACFEYLRGIMATG